jgi:hypothetical protein
MLRAETNSQLMDVDEHDRGADQGGEGGARQGVEGVAEEHLAVFNYLV